MPAKSTCTEWSTTRSTGTSGSIIFGILAQRLHGGAHRGEIDEQRHAGEVLQHDARDDEGNLVVAGRLRVPVGEVRTSPSVTFLPSQLRSTDSSTMRMVTGSFETGPTPCFSSSGRE